MAIIAIIAHYISHVGEAKDYLLSLRRILGAHSGENMAQLVTTIIRETYKLTDRISYFILDNISSNNIYVREILTKLRPNLTKENRRLRYFGYIINLAAKAFVFGKDPEAFEAEADSYI
jgi:hypothetical protein